MRIRRIVTASAATAFIALAVASPAGAASSHGKGDPQGKPEMGPEHANSLCAYSGLNDNPSQEFPEGGMAQSYGQLVAQGLKAEFPSPGIACNPTVPFEEH